MGIIYLSESHQADLLVDRSLTATMWSKRETQPVYCYCTPTARFGLQKSNNLNLPVARTAEKMKMVCNNPFILYASQSLAVPCTMIRTSVNQRPR